MDLLCLPCLLGTCLHGNHKPWIDPATGTVASGDGGRVAAAALVSGTSMCLDCARARANSQIGG